MRELGVQQQWESWFSFCQPGSHDGGRGDWHGVVLWLIDGYDVFVIDILL